MFILFFYLIISIPVQAQAKDVDKKDVAKYGSWTVTLNYQDVANPTCQIWSEAVSPEMTHGGMITIWRDYKSKWKYSDEINIEVIVFDERIDLGGNLCQVVGPCSEDAIRFEYAINFAIELVKIEPVNRNRNRDQVHR